MKTIIAVVGLVASALYVGYLAYAIKALPLWVIVAVTLLLALRDFALDMAASNGSADASPPAGRSE